MNTMPLNWKVKPILDEHKTSVYRFWQDSELANQVAYGISTNKHQALDTRVVEKVIVYLRDLTGNPDLNIGDIVEYIP